MVCQAKMIEDLYCGQSPQYISMVKEMNQAPIVGPLDELEKNNKMNEERDVANSELKLQGIRSNSFFNPTQRGLSSEGYTFFFTSVPIRSE
jgi:hypothetical protein